LDDPGVEVTAIFVGSARLGKAGQFRAKVRRGMLFVSKRDGPSGAPFAESVD
jgi:hypothetical protein